MLYSKASISSSVSKLVSPLPAYSARGNRQAPVPQHILSCATRGIAKVGQSQASARQVRSPVLRASPVIMAAAETTSPKVLIPLVGVSVQAETGGSSHQNFSMRFVCALRKQFFAICNHPQCTMATIKMHVKYLVSPVLFCALLLLFGYTCKKRTLRLEAGKGCWMLIFLFAGHGQWRDGCGHNDWRSVSGCRLLVGCQTCPFVFSPWSIAPYEEMVWQAEGTEKG